MRPVWLVLMFCALALDVRAQPENRIIVGLAQSQMTVGAFGYQESFEFAYKTIEVEASWDNRKYLPLNGIAIGFRKTGLRYNEGTYLTFRTFKRFDVGAVEIHPSLTLVFGTPGTDYDRSWVERGDDGETTSYTHIFPARSFPVPANGVTRIGIIYPEASVAFRRTFGRFHIEPVFGMKFIRMGAVRSNFEREHERRMMGFSPILALRIGFRFF